MEVPLRGPLGPGVVSALAELVGRDAEIEADAPRLRRALADLLPDQDRVAGLVARSAEHDVARLVRAGRNAEAFAALVDTAAMRPEVARDLVHLWVSVVAPARRMAALDGVDDLPGPTAGDGWSDRLRGPESVATVRTGAVEAGERPQGASIVRLGAFADGTLLVTVGTPDGLFAAAAGPLGAGPWRRVATPASPLSRDVCVLSPLRHDPVVFWTDRSGVKARSVSPGVPADDAPGPLSLEPAQAVVAIDEDLQPRYPLAVVAGDDELLDVFWTSDRRALRRSSVRGHGVVVGPVELPEPCRAPERLTGMDVQASSPGRCAVAVLTDRSRILVAEWDVHLDVHCRWTSVGAPVSTVTSIALVPVDDGLLLLATTSEGRLFSVPVEGATADAAPWHQLGRPPALPAAGSVRGMAAVRTGDTHCLAMAGTSGVWLVPCRPRGARLELGPAALVLT